LLKHGGGEVAFVELSYLLALPCTLRHSC
jgi:hypothetical protein